MKQFFVYTTIWSEGNVVACTSDALFAVAPDPYGNLHYATMDKLLSFSSFQVIAMYDSEAKALQHDTSYYPRYNN